MPSTPAINLFTVMPGNAVKLAQTAYTAALAGHPRLSRRDPGVDGRDKPGHDDFNVIGNCSNHHQRRSSVMDPQG